MSGSFQRLADQNRKSVAITINGEKASVLEGDTILTAILLHQGHLRFSEFGDGKRAGFCLMGACQDCWVTTAEGERLRACTSYVTPDLVIVTEGGS